MALNFSSSAQNLDLSLAAQEFIQTKTTMLLTTSSAEQTANGKQHTIQLSPYAVYIGRIAH